MTEDNRTVKTQLKLEEDPCKGSSGNAAIVATTTMITQTTMMMTRSRTDVQLALPVEVENKIIKELVLK